MAAAHFNLGVICVFMFIGPLLAGAIPLALHVATGWTKWMELLGAGVLVGSAFAVVLPEGFKALYEDSPPQNADNGANDDDAEEPLLSLDGDHHHHRSKVTHWLPGTALLAGFLTMVLFEFVHHDNDLKQPALPDCTQAYLQQPRSCMTSSLAPESQDISLHPIRTCGPIGQSPCWSRNLSALQELPCSTSGPTHGRSPSPFDQRSVFVALLVHAATDGLAVGVASMSTSTRLAIAIGLAMVLHKGPVAFGLSAYLLSQHVPRFTIWTDVMMFAVVAPVAALLSYGVLRMVNGSTSNIFVASCVLYSAGTFVYAACDHILPDLSGEAHTWGSITALCLGALIPCSLNLFDLPYH